MIDTKTMKPENQTDHFIVSSSPHTHSGSSVRRIMLDVLIALAPAFAAACYFFGMHAVRLTAICVGTCLACEWLCRRAMRRENTVGDLSAAVTGVLLALNLPPALPGWMAVTGSVFAIGICKQIFGGLGYNVFNPALAARAFMLVSFTGAMTTWSHSEWAATLASGAADVATGATPLGVIKEALKAGGELPRFGGAAAVRLFTGEINGCLGETSALALLAGAAYLLYRRVITWHIPAAYLGTVFAYACILFALKPEAAVPPHIHLLSGGVIIGACFMATDMVTSPVTRKGMLIFGVGCGIVTMVIRTVKTGAFPEGVSFAILFMNALTPLINRGCRNKVFGTNS
jgi:Na+-translocating ferredoxin:NAD+ oxidoreductase subunit D